MAKEYFDKLPTLVSELNLFNEVSQQIEIKHFFSGSSLYANDTICVSWLPAGLALKLADSKVDNKLWKNCTIKIFSQWACKKRICSI